VFEVLLCVYIVLYALVVVIVLAHSGYNSVAVIGQIKSWILCIARRGSLLASSLLEIPLASILPIFITPELNN